MALKTGIVPPGGWKFNAHGIEFKNHGLDELVDDVLKYRAQNMLPIGDPMKEIEHQICSQYPSQCDTWAVVSDRPPMPTEKRLIDKIMEWCQKVYSSDREQVTDMVANNRAATCSLCPYRVEWESQCPKCVNDVRRLTMILRNGKDAIHGQQCKACKVYEFDCRTAVWLKDVKREKHPAAYAQCWVGS